MLAFTVYKKGMMGTLLTRLSHSSLSLSSSLFHTFNYFLGLNLQNQVDRVEVGTLVFLSLPTVEVIEGKFFLQILGPVDTILSWGIFMKT